MDVTQPRDGFWDLLTVTERDALSGLGRISRYPPGTMMCVEGDQATHVFVLVAGWVKVFSVTTDGHEIVLALRGRGDILGEVAGEATGYRIATVQAIDMVSSLVVSHERFSLFLDLHPGAARAYRHAITRRWSDTDKVLRIMSHSSGAERLAKLLLDLAGRHGNPAGGEIEIAMPLSQDEMASLLGISRATVTRALGNWRVRGFIRTGQRHLTIVDVRALRQIADRRR